ncbi:MAG: hypothetical protein VXW84_06100 [Verrucomicrobiota bacterium]|nr:hypothetical protein [Verrucomicrobiota bacterium]
MKWIHGIILFGAGCMLWVIALGIPDYLRAMSPEVLAMAKSEPGLESEASSLLSLHQPGVSQILIRAAQIARTPDAERLVVSFERYELNYPSHVRQGHAQGVFEPVLRELPGEVDNVMEWMMRRSVRRTLGSVHGSGDPGLQFSQRVGSHPWNYQWFEAPGKPGGQVMESLLILWDLLEQGGHLSDPLKDDLRQCLLDLNDAPNLASFESACADLLSLARRMNWGQLSAFMRKISGPKVLQALAAEAAVDSDRMAVFAASLWFAEDPERLVDYYQRFPETAFLDLGCALRYGQGGLSYLLERFQPLVPTQSLRGQLGGYCSAMLGNLGARVAFVAHPYPILLRWLCMAMGLLCWFRCLTLLPIFSSWGPSDEAIDWRRTVTWTAMATLLAIVCAEPFLAQDSESSQNFTTWSFPVLVDHVDQAFGPMMDTQFSQVTFLALGVFFLIQVGIYVLCLIKLKEIQKQSLDSQLKLRLLDNEDNMFDAGLYVGLAGTVLSLVCLALGIIKPGLMAAYASTLFGIIFVSVLKILHVRPYRRQLILEEAAPPA